MICPVSKPYLITTPFGKVPGYPLNNGFHLGVDFVTDDRMLYMAEDAIAEVVPWDGKSNVGNAVYYTVGNKRVAYCHLEEFYIQSGFIKAGTPIGKMGKTGYADGVHLHFVVRINGEYVDPLTLIQEDDVVTPEEVDLAFQAGFNRRASKEEVDLLNGKPVMELLSHTAKYNIDFRTKASEFDNVERALKESYVEIERLRAELATGDTAQLNALGSALRWFITRLGLKN